MKETIYNLIHEVKVKVLNIEVTGGAQGDIVGAAPPRISDTIFHHLEELDVHIRGYNPLNAGTYIPTPNKLAKSKAILNIQNTDEKFSVGQYYLNYILLIM